MSSNKHPVELDLHLVRGMATYRVIRSNYLAINSLSRQAWTDNDKKSYLHDVSAIADENYFP